MNDKKQSPFNSSTTEPSVKRVRTEDAESSTLAPSTSTSIRIQPILSEQISSASVPLVEWFVCVVIDSSSVSQCLRCAKTAFPADEGISHLKWVRRVHKSSEEVHFEVLLCPTDGAPECDVLRRLQAEIAKTKSKSTKFDHDSLKLRKRAIPMRAAVTRQQQRFCDEHWPCRFRPDDQLESAISDCLFLNGDRTRIARHVATLANCDRSGNCAAKCRMVDPTTNRLIVETEADVGDVLGHSITRAIGVVSEDTTNGRHHLCNGIECFASSDCCCMCAGALVLSRIYRVFILADQNGDANGAFGNPNIAIHCRPQLNHNFDVYEVMIHGSDIQ